MNRKYIKLFAFVSAAALTLSFLVGCSFKTNTAASPDVSAPETAVSPSTVPASPVPSVNKKDIEDALALYGESVIDITWAPDNSAVVFIKLTGDTSNIYLWKVGTDAEKSLMAAEPTTDGFLWSPNSKYFLVNVGHMGPGTITSTLFNAESMELISSDISTASISPPVWSPDSRFLALSSWADYKTAELLTFAVASKTTVSLVKSSNSFGPYVVETWGEDNIIKYTEMTSSSDRAEKTIELGE
ncbi:MAG: hypothetical protein EOM51_07085 [Clostridia bacterium]|nr:hypothetical protein [Clostridia bacterium]